MSGRPHFVDYDKNFGYFVKLLAELLYLRITPGVLVYTVVRYSTCVKTEAVGGIYIQCVSRLVAGVLIGEKKKAKKKKRN